MLSNLRTALLALAVVVSVGERAAAQNYDTKSANYWLIKCRSPQYSQLYGECLAFI
jgi:hypothetical protein